MKKQWAEVAGLAVMLSEEERALGSLNAVFMDPEKNLIIGFLVGFNKILTPIEIEGWHSDYVKVRDADSLASLSEILRLQEYGLRRTLLNAKRVCSKSGKTLGRVRDFCFDSSSTSLLTFEVSKRFLWLEWGKRMFSAQEIFEVTEKWIRLSTEPEQKVKEGLPVVARA